MTLSERRLLKSSRLLSRTRESRNSMTMSTRRFKDTRSVLNKNVRIFSRSGLTKTRNLKPRNRTLRISMMLRDVLSRILRLKETNRSPNLRESVQS